MTSDPMLPLFREWNRLAMAERRTVRRRRRRVTRPARFMAAREQFQLLMELVEAQVALTVHCNLNRRYTDSFQVESR